MVLAHLLYGNACAKGAGETVSFGRKGWCLDTFGLVDVFQVYREQKPVLYKVLKRECNIFDQLSNAKWWQISGCLGILLHFLWKSIIRHHPTREERWTYSESQDAVILNSWPGEHFIPYTWDITTEKFGWMYLAFTPHSIIHDITGWRGKGVCHAGVNGSVRFFWSFQKEKPRWSQCAIKQVYQRCPTVFFYQRFTETSNNIKPIKSQSSNHHVSRGPRFLEFFPKVVLVESCRSSTALLLPVTWHSSGVLNIS